jgi:hypothetical protein
MPNIGDIFWQQSFGDIAPPCILVLKTRLHRGQYRRICQYRRQKPMQYHSFFKNSSSSNIADSANIAENSQYRRNFFRFLLQTTLCAL